MDGESCVKHATAMNFVIARCKDNISGSYGTIRMLASDSPRGSSNKEDVLKDPEHISFGQRTPW